MNALFKILDALDDYVNQSVRAAVVSQTGNPRAGYQIGQEAQNKRRLLVERVQELEQQLASLTKERDHWRHNHADQVRRARVLLERHDLPLERVAAYDHVLRLQNALKAATKMMRQHAGTVGSMHSWWDDIGEFEAILAGKPTQFNWLKEQD